MRQYRFLFLFLGLGAVIFLPLVVFGQVLNPGSGWSIVPATCNCPGMAAGWGCVIDVVSNLVQFAIYLAVIITVLMIAYAGFLWVLNPLNPENRSAGRALLMNAAIGLVLTLSAWLIVNTLLTVIGAGGVAGTTSILGGGADKCLKPQKTGLGGVPTGTGLTPTTPPSGSHTNVPANIQAGVNKLDSQALSSSSGQCALYVRQALAAEGYTDFNTNHPADAYQYGPYLTNDGFTAVSNNISGFSPQAGDVAVFQPVPGHDSGHIAMYDGSQWVSDFTQKSFFVAPGYQSGSYTIYRPPTGG